MVDGTQELAVALLVLLAWVAVMVLWCVVQVVGEHVHQRLCREEKA